MTTCRKCLAKAKKIDYQEQIIDNQRSELDELRRRVRDLEDALRTACDYSEACEHFPGREVLAAGS